jgi:hypothetical protein
MAGLYETMDLPLNPEGVYETPPGYTTSWMTVELAPFLSPCGLIFYECELCTVQFSAREFRPNVYRKHLVEQHLQFVGYKCHATETSTARSDDHSNHPSLLGTTLTDSAVDNHSTAARLLLEGQTRSGVRRKHMFPYVDVTILAEDRRLFICAYCNFDSASLATYKKHVVMQHVCVIERSIPFPLIEGVERTGLSVYPTPTPPTI